MIRLAVSPDPALNTVEPVTIAILAGGKGVRMGAPKDRLAIHGRPILLHLLDRLRRSPSGQTCQTSESGQTTKAHPSLLVTSADRPEPIGHHAFDLVTIDRIAGAGPLAGLSAALAASQTALTAVLSVDMPMVTADQVDWLSAQLSDRRSSGHDTLGLLLRRQEADGHRTEPFPAIYHRSARTIVDRRLAQATSTADPSAASLHRLLEETGFELVDAPTDWPNDLWLNLNRPQDILPHPILIL